MSVTKLRERIELVQSIAETQTGDRLELSPQTGRPRFAEIVDDPQIADGLVIGAALIIGTVKVEKESLIIDNGKAIQRFPKKAVKMIMLDHFGTFAPE